MGAPINMGKNKGRRADQSSDSLGERSKIPKMKNHYTVFTSKTVSADWVGASLKKRAGAGFP